MSAVTASLCWTLLFVVFVSADQEIITAESGDVTLTCRAPNNNIVAVEWSRADLEDEYVLLYRAGFFLPDNQHPSFKNRVDLQDRQMKDGDVSVILKDVTTDDAGTYECRVIMEETHSLKPISIINLTVVSPGHTGGSVGLIVGLSVSAVLFGAVVLAFLVVVGAAVFVKRKKQNYYKTSNAGDYTQPLSSSWEDSYSAALKTT